MKTILLATDLRTETNRALERAVKLSLALSVKLHVIHVCPSYSFSKKKKSISLKQDAQDMLKTALAGCKGAKNIHSSITVLEGGETYIEIIKYAEKVKAGLIVMGMHGKAKLLDMFVGTTIERVIRKGTVPVLMVKNKPRSNYKKILVGTDFSDGSREALLVAAELVPKGDFHLVHTYGYCPIDLRDHTAWYADETMAKTARNKLEKFNQENEKMMKKFKVDPGHLHLDLVKGEAGLSLLDEVAKLKADLIVIGTHSGLNLMPYKIGGTAKDILSNPPCDVLIAKGL